MIYIYIYTHTLILVHSSYTYFLHLYKTCYFSLHHDIHNAAKSPHTLGDDIKDVILNIEYLTSNNNTNTYVD